MPETLFEELKRYVGFDGEDEQALRALAPLASPHFKRITDVFYDRILEHEGSRKALERGESQVGHLKVKLAAWLETLLQGPWDESYYQLRCRIGHVHVRVALPEHYMFGAMNVLRSELDALTDQHLSAKPSQLRLARLAISKALDLELAIMLHTYREDILAQQGRSERLSTFGQLVGSIGHELRNPLGVMETSLFILKGRVGADERITKHLSRIEEQLALANKIISDLLDMIRDKPLNPEQVNLLEIIETAKASVSAPPGVKVSVEGTPALPAVRGDRGQLRQVFLNLFDNAVHASSPHGSVNCTVAVTQGRLRVVIQDSGPGVDDATRRRLFEPLVTTKDNGVGLGLALVKRIIERHGGTIVYDPLSTGGARFVILFPLSSELRDA